MKLLKTILLIAVHGAQASHKVTTNAVEAETTQSLAVEAATATFIKMPGAVAKLFGRADRQQALMRGRLYRRSPQAPRKT